MCSASHRPQDADVGINTTLIATEKHESSLGKYLVRPLWVQMVWTHFPVFRNFEAHNQSRWANPQFDAEYNILHLKQTSSYKLEYESKTRPRPYLLTQHIVERVKAGLRDRYTANV